MESVPCSLCGADAPRPYFQRLDRFSGRVFQFVTCSQCGLVYLNPRPCQEELADYYPDGYEAYGLVEDGAPGSAAWHARRALEMQLAFVERFAAPGGRLLDVGCATGNFLRLARERGWDGTGLEVVAAAAEVARQRWQLTVLNTPLEQAGLPEGSFDAVTLWDVLEHLPDPVGALRRCHDLLKPGGVVVFSIPNLDSFDRRLFGRSWIGWDAPRHFTMFDRQTLARAISAAGLELVHQDCFLGGKGTFLLSLEFILQDSALWPAVERSVPLLSALLWPYRQVSYRLKRGPIISFVARKGA